MFTGWLSSPCSGLSSWTMDNKMGTLPVNQLCVWGTFCTMSFVCISYLLKVSRVSLCPLTANATHPFMSGGLSRCWPCLTLSLWWLIGPDCRKWEGPCGHIPQRDDLRHLLSGPFRGYFLAPLAGLWVPEPGAGSSATVFQKTGSALQGRHMALVLGWSHHQ